MLIKTFVATLLVLQVCWAAKITNYFHPRITDGVEAAPGEFPYQVSIIWGQPPYRPYQHNCGGSIINERYVLTAGHCIMDFGTMKVVVGRHSINNTNEFEQTIEIAESYVHELFTGDISENDIALLRLETPIVYNERVAPLVLPAQGELQTGYAVLTGWGSVSKKVTPIYPDILQKADVTLIDNQECSDALSEVVTATGENVNIASTQICSGPMDDTISACSGDSGGPLVQFVEGVPVQVGLVSFGLYPCGRFATPSVYTRVSSYIDWIYDHMDLAKY